MGGERLERREVFSGFFTMAEPYLVPTQTNIELRPIVTVGDTVPKTGGGTYNMVGIPDGMGAFDNGDGTFTVLVSHELQPTAGIQRAHGSAGAFVSKWTLNKDDYSVVSASDLIQTVQLYDSVTDTFQAQTTAFNRFCSADLPAPTAFFNAATGLGTTEQIYMAGEETTEGRLFGTVVSTGTAYELDFLGKFAWENAVASPFAQNKTIVMGLDDSSRNFSSEGATNPSEVYVYVGAKRAVGNPVERAGLLGGVTFGVRVGLPGAYDVNESTVVSGERFELTSLGDVSDSSAAQLQAASVANTVTQFRRVEDGHWDTQRSNRFYFLTTDNFGGASRLWALDFDDITQPEQGGVISIVIDGALPTSPVEMMDNMTVSPNGDIVIQEDPGNQTHLAKIYTFSPATNTLIQAAQHNPEYFSNGVNPAKFLTQDEESSGVIDVSHILGKGHYIVNVQAHKAIPGELVENGQLLVMNVDSMTPSAELIDGLLSVQGTTGSDSVLVFASGNTVTAQVNGRTLGRFPKAQVEQVRVRGSAGNDVLNVVLSPVGYAAFGGTGNDVIYGSLLDDVIFGDDGNDKLYGYAGNDTIFGGNGSDWLFGFEGNDSLMGGAGADYLYGMQGNDRLDGGDGEDWLYDVGTLDIYLNGEFINGRRRR
jgi:Ca2+-binding RTX toxin-like protein